MNVPFLFQDSVWDHSFISFFLMLKTDLTELNGSLVRLDPDPLDMTMTPASFVKLLSGPSRCPKLIWI